MAKKEIKEIKEEVKKEAPKKEIKKEIKKVAKKVEKKEAPLKGILETPTGYKVCFRGKEEIFNGEKSIALKEAVKKYRLLKGF